MWCFEMGQESRMRVRRVAKLSLEDLTVRRCAQECSLAGRADASCRRRWIGLLLQPRLTTVFVFFFSLFFPLVLTGVDETKATTANGKLGDVERLVARK